MAEFIPEIRRHGKFQPMPLLDIAQLFGNLRADRNQRRTEGLKCGVELPLIIRQGQIASRTAGKTEKDKDGRTVLQKRIKYHRTAADLRERDRINCIANFDKFGAIGIFD